MILRSKDEEGRCCFVIFDMQCRIIAKQYNMDGWLENKVEYRGFQTFCFIDGGEKYCSLLRIQIERILFAGANPFIHISLIEIVGL